MSLDTKYRPKTYNDVLGQKGAIKTLRGFVRNNAGWRQSYLFAGPYGSGKTTLGRVLARSLLCEKPQEGEPCDVCGSCVSMLKGSNDAFIEVDAATNSGKADIKQILEEIDYSSFSGRRKLYLFDEAHQLSPSALDALLKPMEENRKGSSEKRLVCIFATTEPEKMRATVLSRCAPAFIIHHVSSEKIADRLEWVCEKEAFTFEKEALLLIADFSEGHIRDALKAIEGVASSNNGHIGIEGVRSYLHVDRNDLICELLISDEKRTLELCEEILATTPVGVAFERLLSATMFSISLGYGSSNPPPYWRVEILEQAWEQNGVNLLRLAENISSVPRKPSVAMFKCEILKWKVPLESYTVTNRVPVKERLRKENSHKQHKEAEKEKKIEEKETMSLSAFIKSVKEIRTVFNEEVKFAGKRNKLGSTSPLS
jgi:DNA polymerase III subunit gamma/tau